MHPPSTQNNGNFDLGETLTLSSETMMALENVQKVYSGASAPVRVFENLNIEMAKSEFITFTGPTGSGKTTLVNLITGFSRPTAGRILVDGTDITLLSNDEMAEFRVQRMGIVFQTSRLIPDMTVFENVELPLALKGERREKRKKYVMDTLETMGVLDFVDRNPSTLSVGEKMRVEIARALVTDPPILIMDEPIENLDSLSKEYVLMVLRGGHCIQEKTVIVTTHSKKTIDAASRVIQLKKRLDLGKS